MQKRLDHRGGESLTAHVPRPWLRSRPAEMDLLRHRAYAPVDCGRHAEAAHRAARACELKPHDPRAHSDLGCIRALSGDVRSAFRALRNANLLDERCADTCRALGESLAATGLAEAALASFARAEELERVA